MFILIIVFNLLHEVCLGYDYKTDHSVNVWPWGNSPYTWEGKCSFYVPYGVTVWTVNVTFDKNIENFVVYRANVISSSSLWQCLESKFYLNTPYTEHMTFQGEYYGSSDAPTGSCTLLWDQGGTCPNGETATTTTTTTTTQAPTTTTTTTQAPTTTTTTTTQAPTTTTTTQASTTTTTTQALTTTTTTQAPTTTTTNDPTTTSTTTTRDPTTGTEPTTTTTLPTQAMVTTTLDYSSTNQLSSNYFMSSLIPSATSLVTNVPTTTESDDCYCFFVPGTVRDDIFAERMRNLTVDRKSVSSAVRRRTSADDDRESAQNIGIVGCISLVVFLGFFVSFDIINFINYMGVFK